MGNTYSPRLFAPALTRMPDDEILSSINSGTAYTPTLSSISLGGARKVKAVSLGSLLKYLGTMGLASYAMNGDYYIQSGKEDDNTIKLYPSVGSNGQQNYPVEGLVDGDRLRFKATGDIRSSGSQSISTTTKGPNTNVRYLKYYAHSNTSGPLGSADNINIKSCINGPYYNAMISYNDADGNNNEYRILNGMWTSPIIKTNKLGELLSFNYDNTGSGSSDELWDGKIRIEATSLGRSYYLTGIYFEKIGSSYPESLLLNINGGIGINIQLSDSDTLPNYVYSDISISNQLMITDNTKIDFIVNSATYKYGNNIVLESDNGTTPNNNYLYYQYNLGGIILELTDATVTQVVYTPDDISTGFDAEGNEINSFIKIESPDPNSYPFINTRTPINERCTNSKSSQRPSEELGAFTSYFGSLGSSNTNDLLPVSKFELRLVPKDGTSFKLGRIEFTAVDALGANSSKSHWVLPNKIKLTNNITTDTYVVDGSTNIINDNLAIYNFNSTMTEYEVTTDYNGSSGNNGSNILSLVIESFTDNTGFLDENSDSYGSKNFINYESIKFYDKSNNERDVVILEKSPKILTGDMSLTGNKKQLYSGSHLYFYELSTGNYGVLRDSNGTRRNFLMRSFNTYTSTSTSSVSDITQNFYCSGSIPYVLEKDNITNKYYLGRADNPGLSLRGDEYIQGGELKSISSGPTDNGVNTGFMYKVGEPGSYIYRSLNDYINDVNAKNPLTSNVLGGSVIVFPDDGTYANLDFNLGSVNYTYTELSDVSLETKCYSGVTRTEVTISGTKYYYDTYDYIYHSEYSGSSLSKFELMTDDENTINYYNIPEYILPVSLSSLTNGIYLPSIYSYKIIPGSTSNTITYDNLLSINGYYGGRNINSITINNPSNPIKSGGGTLTSLFSRNGFTLSYDLGSGSTQSMSNSIMITEVNNVDLSLNNTIDHRFIPYTNKSTIDEIMMIYPSLYYSDTYKLSLSNDSGAPIKYYTNSNTYDYLGALISVSRVSTSSSIKHQITKPNQSISGISYNGNYNIMTTNNKYHIKRYTYPSSIFHDNEPDSSLTVVLPTSSDMTSISEIKFTRFNDFYPNKVLISGDSTDHYSAANPNSNNLFDIELPGSDIDISEFIINYAGNQIIMSTTSSNNITTTYEGSYGGIKFSGEVNKSDKKLIITKSDGKLNNGKLSSIISFNSTNYNASTGSIIRYGCHKSLRATTSSVAGKTRYDYDVGPINDDNPIIISIKLGITSLSINIPQGAKSIPATISGKPVIITKLTSNTMGVIQITSQTGDPIGELDNIEVYYTPSVINKELIINRVNSVTMNVGECTEIVVSIDGTYQDRLTPSQSNRTIGGITFNASLSPDRSKLTGEVVLSNTNGVYGNITLTSNLSVPIEYVIGFNNDNIITHSIKLNNKLSINNTNGIKLKFTDFSSPATRTNKNYDDYSINYGSLSQIVLIADGVNGTSKYIEVYPGDPNLGYETIPLLDPEMNTYSSNGLKLLKAKLLRPIRYVGYNEDNDSNTTLLDIVDGDIIRNNIYTVIYRSSYYDKDGTLKKLDEPYFELQDYTLNLRPTVDHRTSPNTYNYILPKVYQSGLVKVLTVSTDGGNNKSRVNQIFAWSDGPGNCDLLGTDDYGLSATNYKEGHATLMLMSYVDRNIGRSGWTLLGGVNTWNLVTRPSNLDYCGSLVPNDRLIIMY